MAGQLTYEIDRDPETQSLADRDAAFVTAGVDVGELARRAEAATGIPLKKLAKGMRAFTGGNGAARGGVGMVNGVEYFRWRMYEVPKKDRDRFVSDKRQWEIEAACNDQATAEKTVRKSTCTELLQQAGLPTIPIEAVIDTSGATHGSHLGIDSPQGLADFLGATPPPLFAKPNELLGSFGAFAIEEFDGDRVRISTDGWVPIDDLLTRLVGEETYLVQKVLENHDDLAALSPRLGTIRTVNLVGTDTVATPFCIYKIPAAGNVADNFWRPGNLLANVEPQTGEVVRVVTGIGGDQCELSHHPDTGAEILGRSIPFWEDLRRVNEMCCRLFSGVRYQCLDIAMTNSGPVIVEVNSGGSFDLPQVATGRGFLIDEVREFFESFGVDLHTRA